MATARADRNLCDACGKVKGISKCEGCAKIFCYNHFGDHRQELNKQLDEVEVTRDLFRQTLTQQTTDPQKHALIQQVDEWERESIKKIRQTAEEVRQMLFTHTSEYNTVIEVKLSKLTDQLRQSRHDNDFVETELHQWKEQLAQLTEQLAKASNITIQEESTALVKKICVNVSSGSLRVQNIGVNAKWIQNGVIVAGGNGMGNGLNQVSQPWGLCIDDDDQTIYVADYSNHRIVEWKHGATSGQVVVGGNGPGDRPDQLNAPTDVILDKKSDSLIICDRGNQRVVRWPRRNGTTGEIIISNIDCWGLAMDDDGYLYVSDDSKHEVRRWKIGDTNGTVVAGGNGEGNRLDQLNRPHHIFVDHEYSVYVSDCKNHRVMKWVKGAKEGIVVAGGRGKGNGLTQLSSAMGVIVDQMGTTYIADQRNHRVMRWPRGATQGSVVIGGNGQGEQANQLSNPSGLSFDQQNNLYVVDYSNHRVQKFSIDSSSNT